MGIFLSLSSLAVQGVVKAACDAAGLQKVGEHTGEVVGFLTQHFTDHSLKLAEALKTANERAWKALEIALAGESWWERCQVLLASGEQKGFRQQVQAFLQATPLGGLPGQGEDFRQQCLRELKAARKKGVLTGGVLEPGRLARRAGAFARFADPGKLLDAEWAAMGEMAGQLREAGFPNLAKLLTLRPPQGVPVLVAGARYFLNREIEKDQELFQGLAFARLEHLGRTQEQGFAALGAALDQHGGRLEELLSDVRAALAETHGSVLDIKAELERQGQQMRELGQAVLAALEQHRLERRELRPGDSLSVQGDAERQALRGLLARYRALPEEQRRRQPALLNAVGKLEVVTGEFEAAQRSFQTAADLVPDPAARAEARYNAYRAALERRAWPEALESLREAARLDPERFAPFPLAKFEPERILGAGGFGVAFLCKNRLSGSRVVIKTLGEGLGRDLGEVLREAQVLEQLDHPAIIRLRDCDYADASRTRPFLVMDYFPGPTLAQYVEERGPLPPQELVPLARLVAQGLEAAHARGVLHRDVKPANLLVRRDAGSWQVKLIDFGLALGGGALKSTLRSQGDRTLLSSSIAGTVDYAAPEQMGRLPGVTVAPYSDVYGFGKMCCYALFKTPQPTWQHWQKLPPPLADLLGRCLSETPAERPADFGTVLRELERLTAPAAPRRAAPAVAIPEVLPVEEDRPVSRSTARSAPRRTPVESRRPLPRAREPEPLERAPRRQQRSVWPVVLIVPGVALVAGLVVGLAVYIGRNLHGGGTATTGTGGGHAVQIQTRTLPLPGGLGEPRRVVQPRPLTELRPSAEPATPVKPEEFARVLAELKTADPSRRAELAQRLAVTPPMGTADERAQVARALESLLQERQTEPRQAACKALGEWGNRDNVPALIGMLNDLNGNVRGAAIAALVRLKDERAIKPIAARLKDVWDRQRGNVTGALEEFGPAAEDAVIPMLNGDHFTRLEAIKVLKAIGTQKSIPPLEEAAADRDVFVRRAAADALQVIRAR